MRSYIIVAESLIIHCQVKRQNKSNNNLFMLFILLSILVMFVTAVSNVWLWELSRVHPAVWVSADDTTQFLFWIWMLRIEWLKNRSHYFFVENVHIAICVCFSEKSYVFVALTEKMHIILEYGHEKQIRHVLNFIDTNEGRRNI